MSTAVAGGTLEAPRALGRPFVTAKAAVTLDGRMATASGSSKWITGEAARRHVHAMRAESDAVMVGVGTVLADDPSLTVREVPGPSPLRVVVDSRLRTPVDAAVARTATDVPTWVAHGPAYEGAARDALVAVGVTCVELPLACGRVDLRALLAALHARGVSRLLVEGGAKLHRALFERRLVDRVALFFAPKFVGGAAASVFDVAHEARTMDDAWVLRNVEHRSFGDDLLVVGDVPPASEEVPCSPA